MIDPTRFRMDRNALAKKVRDVAPSVRAERKYNGKPDFKFKKGKSYLYFLENDGCSVVKIGITKNVSSRISTLQTSSPWKLNLLGLMEFDTEPEALSTEKILHEHFSKWRVSGEWFRVDHELYAWLSVFCWLPAFRAGVNEGIHFECEKDREEIDKRVINCQYLAAKTWEATV